MYLFFVFTYFLRGYVRNVRNSLCLLSLLVLNFRFASLTSCSRAYLPFPFFASFRHLVLQKACIFSIVVFSLVMVKLVHQTRSRNQPSRGQKVKDQLEKVEEEHNVVGTPDKVSLICYKILNLENIKVFSALLIKCKNYSFVIFICFAHVFDYKVCII